MNDNTIRILWFYWLVLIVGLVGSFAIFTRKFHQFDSIAWLAATLAVGGAGLLMVIAGSHDIRRQRQFHFLRHVRLGLCFSLLFGLLIYFSIHLLGFYVFYLLDYIYWIFLLVGAIYFEIIIRKLSRSM